MVMAAAAFDVGWPPMGSQHAVHYPYKIESMLNGGHCYG